MVWAIRRATWPDGASYLLLCASGSGRRTPRPVRPRARVRDDSHFAMKRRVPSPARSASILPRCDRAVGRAFDPLTDNNQRRSGAKCTLPAAIPPQGSTMRLRIA